MDKQDNVPEEAVIDEAVSVDDGCGEVGENSRNEAGGEPTGNPDEGKKPLKKKAKPDKQKERIAELEDRVLRQMAEFENFRKRSEKEKSQMFEVGARSVLEKILPVVDNFERGLAALPEAEAGSPFAEGMNMIYKQLMGELDSLEVKTIPTVGAEFDPELHNAVMQMASEEYASGIIAQEMQKGYTYRGAVIRHSMVAVVE
jgi:molecular chaperone GrpE